MADNGQLSKTVLSTEAAAPDGATLARTVISPGTTKPTASPPAPIALTQAVRTTVLPQIEYGQTPTLRAAQRERYEELEPLGQGGMGEVVLLKDHDIDREVALKRLAPGASSELVMRFIEEVHAVGQLEHPNIMPLHDVGLDDKGRYFFVMKRLKGDTMEAIIEKLRAGDADAHARYPFAVREQIFLGVLHAMAYAHKQGFIHRDLKPANIMVGPFGEVTVMDWGLAKRLHGPELPAARASPDAAGLAGDKPVSVARSHTQVGVVMGTPFYMSPEQICGETDKVDQRTDTYALSVILHEWMGLVHYLEGRETLEQISDGILNTSPDLLEKHPTQALIPPDIGHIISEGMDKDPAKRFQSVDEMIARLQRSFVGNVLIQCPRTFTKRLLNELTRAADAHPYAMLASMAGLLAFAFLGIFGAVAMLR